MVRSMVCPPSTMVRAASAWAPPSSSTSTSAKPITPVSGVRISWLSSASAAERWSASWRAAVAASTASSRALRSDAVIRTWSVTSKYAPTRPRTVPSAAVHARPRTSMVRVVPSACGTV